MIPHSKQLIFFNVKLEDLPDLHRIAFAAACCERLLPTYYVFAREGGPGNPSILRSALDEIWNILEGQEVNINKNKTFIQDIECEIQKSEDIFTRYDWEANLAAYAIIYILEACIESADLVKIMKIMKNIEDTIYGFIEIQKDIQNDSTWAKKSYKEKFKEVKNHPFILREIAKQNLEVQKLRQKDTLDSNFLQEFQKSSTYNGKSVVNLL